MLFELLGFLLSTNAKVKKMTTVSAVMLEIVEKYIYFKFICIIFFSVLYAKAKQRRDFVSSGIFSYSTGIFLGKYPDNGGKAEKTKNW
jgi:hypothetical protein